MISITETAKARLLAFADEEGIKPFVRVKCVSGGCAGMANDMNFEEIVNDSDFAFEFGEIKIIIDQISFSYLENTEIDYVENAYSSGFKFNNPQVSGSCGCGNSSYY